MILSIFLVQPNFLDLDIPIHLIGLQFHLLLGFIESNSATYRFLKMWPCLMPKFGKFEKGGIFTWKLLSFVKVNEMV